LAVAATALAGSGGVRLRLIERDAQAPSLGRVREAEALLAEAASRGADGPTVAAVVEDARDLVDALPSAAGEGPEARRLALVMFAAGVIAGLAVEDELAIDEIGSLMPRLAGVAELPPEATTFAIFERAIRDPRLVELPSGIAIEMNLKLLSSFAPIGAASLWKIGRGESPQCLCHTGCSTPTRRMRLAAQEAAGDAAPVRARPPAIRAVTIERSGEVRAVLVVRANPGEGERAVAFARESARALELVLGRAALLEHDISRERSLLESSERRLVRLGFDLHDGPLQDVGAAMLQLRLLRTELGRALPPGSERETVLDRLAELERSLVESETELRDLARSAGSSALRRSLRSTIESEAEAFASSAGLQVRVELSGDLESITASQKIALIRVVQEALTNAGRHGGATEAHVRIALHPDGVRAEISDNGCGFDVERTLVDAARRGRIGLLGMSERVRLLGGTFDVHSCPGGATVVSLSLPNWRPIWMDADEATA
jgi:signal transduction histidine kinase